MKLQRQISRVVGEKEYEKWVIVVPPPRIRELGWREGMELEAIVRGDELVIRPLENKPEKPKRMTYEEFKEIIREELEKAPEGLTWTQIKGRRSELYQKVPNNLWVRMLEQDIGLVRVKDSRTGKTIWRLKG